MNQVAKSEQVRIEESVVCGQAAETLEETARWRTSDQEPLVGSETILFVEDEAFVREVACEVLRSAGYRVLTARNAAEAERAYELNSGAVELLLTDVVLPGENGRALAARLRRENAALKVLLVTGYAEQMGLHEAQQEHCLAKPFSTGELLRAVRQLLDHAELRSRKENLAMPACGNELLAESGPEFERRGPRG